MSELSTVERRRRRFSEPYDPLLVPGALAVAVCVLFAAEEAGYPQTVWYPGALFLAALAAIALPPLWTPPRRAVAVAAACLAAYTLWSFVSIGWSDVRGDAWDGANRTLLYLVVFVLFAFLPWRAGSVAALLGAWSAAVAALGAITLARSVDANPEAYFLLGRFAEPAGYQNANCALFLMAFFPAAFLAARPEVPAALRALELAAAAVLLELALLTQSRASVAALPVALAVFLVVVPARARVVAFLVPPAVATALASSRLLDVFPAIREGQDAAGALEAAWGAVWITAVAVFAIGLVFAVLDGRLGLPERASRAAGRALGAAAALAAVAAALAVGAGAGDMSGRLDRAWREFTTPTPSALPTESYFSSGVGGNRHDIWRVALDEFRESPLQGAGADNFAVAYLRERRTTEEPLYPHSVELRVLSQTGLVGAALFAGFLVAALVSLLALRRRSVFARGTAAASLGIFGYWLVHGSVDWFWEIPGLGAPAFAALGAATSLARDPDELLDRVRPRRAGLVAVVSALVAAATLVPPWLSAKEVQAAAGAWGSEPRAAFDRLERARALNPLSDNPDLVAGAIASRLGDRARMRTGFTRALERNPHNWYAWFELGVVSSLEGDRAEALRLLARAQALVPREPIVADVAARVRAGRRVSPAGLDRLFLLRTDPEYAIRGAIKRD